MPESRTIKLLYDVTVLGNARQHQWQRTGVFRVVDELARRLAAARSCGTRFCCAVDSEAAESAFKYLDENEELRGVPKLGTSIPPLRRARKQLDRIAAGHHLVSRGLSKVLWETEKLMGISRRQLATCDVFHAPAFFLPETVKAARKPAKFLTIYDLIPILQPEWCRDGSREFLQRALRSLLPDSFAICISEATKQDLCAQLPEFPPERAFVTHLAASDDFYPCQDTARLKHVRQRYGIPEEPYFLSLSTLEPRKNLDHLVRCFQAVTRELGGIEVNLVLVGEKGWKYEALLREVEKSNSRHRVILVGYVGDEDLAPLYTGATAFVYPSLYEGFGLPPLEAMQCGTPVIVSNTSCLPEVVGDAGIKVAPTDRDSLSQSMLSLLNNSELRTEMSRRVISRAAHFSWAKCADQTISAYRQAL